MGSTSKVHAPKDVKDLHLTDQTHQARMLARVGPVHLSARTGARGIAEDLGESPESTILKRWPLRRLRSATVTAARTASLAAPVTMRKATLSPSSAQRSTAGASAAMRAQPGSAYAHLLAHAGT